MILALCVALTMFSGTVFAGAEDTSAEGGLLCHASHDESCGYVEAIPATPCAHMQEDGYLCLPKGAAEGYVCAHDDECGYADAIDGAVCTHTCEQCAKKDGEANVPCDVKAGCTLPMGHEGECAPPKNDDFAVGLMAPGDIKITLPNVDAGTLQSAVNNELQAPYDYSVITGITVQRGILNDQDFLFMRTNLSGLTTFDMSGTSNTSIPNNAFANVNGRVKLQTIILPSSVTSIGNNAFNGCESLGAVDLSHVESIGEGALDGCEALTSAGDTSSLSTIGAFAFNGCKKLQQVDLSNVQSLGEQAFWGCEALTIASGTGFDYLTAIPAGAFSGCKSLKEIDLSNIKSLGAGSFYNCEKLTSLVDTSDLNTIDEYALQGCKLLEEVDITNVQTLGEGAFASCDGLKALALPASKPTIGNDAFAGVSALMLLVKGGGTYTDSRGFPSGSAAPSIAGANINEGQTLSLAVSPNAGAVVSYQWLKDGTEISGETGRTYFKASATPADSGSYTCNITLGSVSGSTSANVTVKSIYTLTFNANGGSGSMENQTFTQGKEQAITKNAFIRAGYDFTGWNTAANGGGTPYTDEQRTKLDADATLYAQWEQAPDHGPIGPTPDPNKPIDTKKDFVQGFAGDYKNLADIRLNGVTLTQTPTSATACDLRGWPGYDRILGKAESGSVMVTLYKEFLQTLPDGKYTLEVKFLDGTAERAGSVQFTVQQEAAPTATPSANPTPAPKTGDGASIALWILLAAAAATILTVMIKRKKTE